MAKCNYCGTRTWFFETHRCKAKSKPKQEICRQTTAARSPSERRLTSMDSTTGLYFQQQQNQIYSVASDPEPCRMTSDFHRPIQNHAPDRSYSPSSHSNECSSPSSLDSGSDSSSSNYSGD